MKRQLTQNEIDAVFQNTSDTRQENETATTTFDFSRLDRITKSQLRSIHLLHEDFVRTLSSNLSAYLRAVVGLNLVSLEQIERCGLDPGARPETLGPRAFNDIAQVLDRDTSGSNA